jgi:hypothetical protein
MCDPHVLAKIMFLWIAVVVVSSAAAQNSPAAAGKLV